MPGAVARGALDVPAGALQPGARRPGAGLLLEPEPEPSPGALVPHEIETAAAPHIYAQARTFTVLR